MSFAGTGGGEAAPDMWPMLGQLAGLPVLIVRGGRSDVLSAATAKRMAASLPGSKLVTVRDVGHTPTLAEPAVATAIDALLARVKEPLAA